jgi:hypothetical protein
MHEISERFSGEVFKPGLVFDPAKRGELALSTLPGPARDWQAADQKMGWRGSERKPSKYTIRLSTLRSSWSRVGCD